MSDLYLNGLTPLIYALSEQNLWDNVYIVINREYDWTDSYGHIIEEIPNINRTKKIYIDNVSINNYDTVSANLIYIMKHNILNGKIVSIYPEGLSSYKYLYNYKRYYMYNYSRRFKIDKLYVVSPRLYDNINKYNINYTNRDFYETFKHLSSSLTVDYDGAYLHSFVGPTTTYNSLSRQEYSNWVEQMLEKVSPLPLYIKPKYYHINDPVLKHILSKYPLRLIDTKLIHYPAEVFFYRGLTKYIGYPSTLLLNMDFNDVTLLDSPNIKLNKHKYKACNAFVRYYRYVTRQNNRISI